MIAFRASLLATALVACTFPAHARIGTLSTRSMVHEGPGREFKALGYVEPGRIPLGQCRLNGHEETWCYVDREVDPGWIHVIVKKPTRQGGGRGLADGGPSTSNGSTTADGGSTSKSRPSGSSSDGGNEGMSPKDAASLPGSGGSSGGTQGDRQAWTAAEKVAEEKANDPSRK